MANFKLEVGMKVHTHLTHFGNDNGSIKGTVVAEILSVNSGSLNFRAKVTKSGAIFTIPFNAVVRPVNGCMNGLRKDSLQALADKFNNNQ